MLLEIKTYLSQISMVGIKVVMTQTATHNVTNWQLSTEVTDSFFYLFPLIQHFGDSEHLLQRFNHQLLET